MSVDVRGIDTSDFGSALGVFWSAVNMHMRPDAVESGRRLYDIDRVLIANDGTSTVGATFSHSFEMVVPGGSTVRIAGVAAVGVVPTHRRRGVFTKLMEAQLNQIAERGESMALLWASEATIYGRFGYGPAIPAAKLTFEGNRPLFRPFEASGSIEQVSTGDVAREYPKLFADYCVTRAGEVMGVPAHLDRYLEDPEYKRNGHSALFHLFHRDERGVIDGYVAYRVEPVNFPTSLHISRMVSTNAVATRTMWKHLLELDLINSFTFARCPVDAPLAWMVQDMRRVKMTSFDHRWLRLIDVQTALSDRKYASDGRVVMRVYDSQFEQNNKTFLLNVEGGYATCEVTAAEPDIEIDVADLAAGFLGGVRYSTLVAAGRCDVSGIDGLQVMDRLFTTDSAPYCTIDF